MGSSVLYQVCRRRHRRRPHRHQLQSLPHHSRHSTPATTAAATATSAAATVARKAVMMAPAAHAAAAQGPVTTAGVPIRPATAATTLPATVTGSTGAANHPAPTTSAGAACGCPFAVLLAVIRCHETANISSRERASFTNRRHRHDPLHRVQVAHRLLMVAVGARLNESAILQRSCFK